MSEILVSKFEPENNINRISLFCIIMLFTLRIPMLGFSSFMFNGNAVSYINNIFMIGTYSFTALFIWLERNKLKDYHMDTIPILIFTLGPLWFLYTNILIRVPMIIVGIILLTALIKANYKFHEITLKSFVWILIGIIVGAITALISSYFLSKQVANTGMKASFSIFITLFITQLTNAAVFEEPFFRGCLWGFLKKMKYKEIVIYIIQAGLFWLGHIYYINKAPYSFWIVVPLGGLVLGLLAWRSRSIGTSMVAHGIMNGLGQLITFYKF
jgi:membrane protease YdiL (CAAX protease family)